MLLAVDILALPLILVEEEFPPHGSKWRAGNSGHCALIALSPSRVDFLHKVSADMALKQRAAENVAPLPGLVNGITYSV